MRVSARTATLAIAALAVCITLSACALRQPSAGTPRLADRRAAETTAPRHAAPATGFGQPLGSTFASPSAESTAATRPVAPPAPARNVAQLPAPIATLPQPKPVKRTLRGPSARGVPVLMYHVIGVAPPGAANPDLYVTPQLFVQQMTYLSEHGYHAVTLQQVWDYWHGSATLPSKPVVLSFDDGDTPDFTVVAPLLAELRWPGTLNLIVGRHRPRMRPPVVRALIDAGWEIDSHTMTHAEVPGLSPAELRYEIAGSRAALQRRYGVPVNFFCYPSGRFDAASIEAVKAAGYLGATTTQGGLARPDQPYLMRRVRVSAGYGPSTLAGLLGEAK